MTYMLCRNRVADFSRWKAVFASHEAVHLSAGLRLIQIWRDVEDANDIFFMFEVASMEKAREFIGNPEAAKAGEVSGVLDGEYHFIEDAGACSDCRVPWLAGTSSSAPARPFDPTLDLVVVQETNDRIQLALAKGLLEEADIPYFVLGQIATLVQSVDASLHKWVRVQVPCDREAEARELLEGMLVEEAGPQDGEEPGGNA